MSIEGRLSFFLDSSQGFIDRIVEGSGEGLELEDLPIGYRIIEMDGDHVSASVVALGLEEGR